jgi:hypothetical protein
VALSLLPTLSGAACATPDIMAAKSTAAPPAIDLFTNVFRTALDLRSGITRSSM